MEPFGQNLVPPLTRCTNGIFSCWHPSKSANTLPDGVPDTSSWLTPSWACPGPRNPRPVCTLAGPRNLVARTSLESANIRTHAHIVHVPTDSQVVTDAEHGHSWPGCYFGCSIQIDIEKTRGVRELAADGECAGPRTPHMYILVEMLIFCSYHFIHILGIVQSNRLWEGGKQKIQNGFLKAQ